MLDRGQDSEGRDQLLIKGLKDFRLRLMGKEGNWQDDWPLKNAFQQASDNAQSGAPAKAIALPQGVEVTLEHETYGEITRIIALPDFDLELARNNISQSLNAGQGQQGENSDGESDSNDNDNESILGGQQ